MRSAITTALLSATLVGCSSLGTGPYLVPASPPSSAGPVSVGIIAETGAPSSGYPGSFTGSSQVGFGSFQLSRDWGVRLALRAEQRSSPGEEGPPLSSETVGISVALRHTLHESAPFRLNLDVVAEVTSSLDTAGDFLVPLPQHATHSVGGGGGGVLQPVWRHGFLFAYSNLGVGAHALGVALGNTGFVWDTVATGGIGLSLGPVGLSVEAGPHLYWDGVPRALEVELRGAAWVTF